MTIDEAIKTLTEYNHYVLPGLAPDEENAFKLGKEALKFIEYCRSGTYDPPFELLPGETKDY